MKLSARPRTRGFRLLALGLVVLAGCEAPARMMCAAGTDAADSAASESPRLDRLTIRTWNIGYAGLDAGADFKEDGGEHLFPKDSATVRDNLASIRKTLSAGGADVEFVQEVAGASLLTRGVDVRAGIEGAFAGRAQCYFPGTVSRLPIGPLDVTVGSFVAARVPVGRFEALMLPGQRTFAWGIFKRRFPVGIVRIPAGGTGAGEWVLANVHLSAFDAEAALRKQQMAALFAFAAAEFDKGNRVVLGGDWNLRLAPTGFRHQTADEFLFWIFDFPQDGRPAGWRLGIDAATPTVRTLQRPYIEGVNYTTVVDGFIVSPNVAVREVETGDLGFAHSDHNPVTIELEAVRGKAGDP